MLLVLVGGVGGWNYHRNLQVEKAEHRPFRGHSDEALDQLLEAYEAEHERGMKRWKSAEAREVSVGDKDYYQDQVGEFERVQGASRAKRAHRDALASSQATLKLLHKEERKRDAERDKLKLFMRRAFTI